MSIDKTPPEDFSPAKMTREELEAVVAKTRVLARLAVDFLYLGGHRIKGHGKGGADPFKAMLTLEALDAQLVEMEGLLGLPGLKDGA